MIPEESRNSHIAWIHWSRPWLKRACVHKLYCAMDEHASAVAGFRDYPLNREEPVRAALSKNDRSFVIPGSRRARILREFP